MGTPGRVLDFGCGRGDAVREFLRRGWDAYGCDFASELDPDGDRLRLIEQPYRLPFDDDTFSLIVSNQVMEHVQDHDLVFRELRRVSRVGGRGVHIYPPRLQPIEPHAFVPLATMIQNRRWLYLWARLGIRNRFQRGLSAREVADKNHRYLRDETNYVPRRQMLRYAERHFPWAFFAEWAYLGGDDGRWPWAIVGPIYGTFRSSALYTIK